LQFSCGVKFRVLSSFSYPRISPSDFLAELRRITRRFKRQSASGSGSFINFLTTPNCVSQNHGFLLDELPFNALNFLFSNHCLGREKHQLKLGLTCQTDVTVFTKWLCSLWCRQNKAFLPLPDALRVDTPAQGRARSWCFKILTTKTTSNFFLSKALLYFFGEVTASPAADLTASSFICHKGTAELKAPGERRTLPPSQARRGAAEPTRTAGPEGRRPSLTQLPLAKP